MAAPRRLLLAVMAAGSLLCFYLLRVNLDAWPGRSGPPAHVSVHRQAARLLDPTGTPHTHSSHLTHTPGTGAASDPETGTGTGNQTGTETRTGAETSTGTRSNVPTEPPFIGDSYMTDDILNQTDCPEGIRSRLVQTDLRSRFLPRVPVLQWAKHAIPDLHRRLSRYPGAHGWGGVDLNTLLSSLSVLNSSSNGQMLDDWATRHDSARCSRCAVVGNGGILKGSGKGAEIDAHDYVFRTNGAIIQGFQQDVGSRTTHYTFSTNTMLNSIRSYGHLGYHGPPVSEETRYVFLPDHDRDYLLAKAAATHSLVERGPERGTDPSRYFGKDVSAAKLKMYHPDFIRYLRNRFLRSNTLNTKYKDIYRPSTGAVMLLAAVHTCDQVSAYGFMTPDYGRYSDHYYDSSFHPVGFYVNHDLRLEMALWQQLHRLGLVSLYGGERPAPGGD